MKIQKTINLISVIVLVVLLPAFLVFYKEVVPKTKTHFFSYQLFAAGAQWTIYPRKLPKSAQELCYYCYEGYMADKSGFHAAFSDEDYELMKDERMSAYHLEYPGRYSYDGHNKMYLDRRQLEDAKVDFLDWLIPEETDNGKYYYLIYCQSGDSAIYNYSAVLCNDETNEIVELTCRICYH